MPFRRFAWRLSALEPPRDDRPNDASLRMNVRLDRSADSASILLRVADLVVGKSNPSMPTRR